MASPWQCQHFRGEGRIALRCFGPRFLFKPAHFCIPQFESTCCCFYRFGGICRHLIIGMAKVHLNVLLQLGFIEGWNTTVIVRTNWLVAAYQPLGLWPSRLTAVISRVQILVGAHWRHPKKIETALNVCLNNFTPNNACFFEKKSCLMSPLSFSCHFSRCPGSEFFLLIPVAGKKFIFAKNVFPICFYENDLFLQ